ncbi:MAG: hypothetical protein PUC92_04495 [bacterium]|nr:hypothetical protein [bacterium]
MRLSEQLLNVCSKEECAHILSGVAKAASRCCELANPAQVRQIASQTGVLLCRMRFVAGRGAMAKLLQAGDRRHRGLPAGALQRRAIGKMLLAGSAMAKRMAALWQRAIGKTLPVRGTAVAEILLAGAPWKTVGSGHGN